MLKQVIIVRKDLKMRSGKVASQVAHASLGCIMNYINNSVKVDEEKRYLGFIMPNNVFDWLMEPSKSPFTKIILQVNSEESLLELKRKADELYINNKLIVDAGNTVFNGMPTVTCLGLGPENDKVLDQITGDLKLF